MLSMTLLLTVACNKQLPIVHDLSERDANEIVVLLARNQIDATKVKEEKNQEVSWSLTVAENERIQAQGILVANNLPRLRQGGLEGVCKDSSMIVTEETEKCRKLLAYKGEIINSLESIPGVVSADVVLNIPDTDVFRDENTPQPLPTASVTLKYLTDANVKTELNEGKIQEFVANSVNGMDARNVTVIISYLEQSFVGDGSPASALRALGAVTSLEGNDKVATEQNKDSDLVSEKVAGIEVTSASATKLKVVFGVILLIFIVLVVGLIFAVVRLSSMRRQSGQGSGAESASDDQKLLKA